MAQISTSLLCFPIAPEFASYWGQSQIGKMIENEYLKLRIQKQDYTEVTEGKGVKVKRGFTSSYGDKEYKRIGFRVRVRSQKEDLYIALRELAEYTAGDNCQLHPIEILDYCHLHDRVDRDRGYRIRTGVFEGAFSQVQGAAMPTSSCGQGVGIAGLRYGSGFSFKFMETDYKYFF